MAFQDCGNCSCSLEPKVCPMPYPKKKLTDWDPGSSQEVV